MSLATVTLFAELLHHAIAVNAPYQVPWRIPNVCSIDAGYCIDAPNDIPAGGMECAQIAEDEFFPLELTAWREDEVRI